MRLLTSDVKLWVGGLANKFSLKFASGYRLRLVILAGGLAVYASDTEVLWNVTHGRLLAVFKALVRPDLRAVAERHGWVPSKRNLLYDCSHVLPPVNLRSCSAKQSFSSSRRMYVLNSDKLSSHFASHSTSLRFVLSLRCLPTLANFPSPAPLDKCELGNSILN